MVPSSFLARAASITLKLSLVLGPLLFSGCAMKPTKTDSQNNRRYFAESTKGLSDLDFSNDAKIIDARPAFAHSLGFIPGAARIQWSDFTQAEEAQRGILQSDLSVLTRRLAALGVGPEMSLTVLGRGLEGEGEEGRVAWMLAYLGVNKVQFADINSVKGKFKFAKSDPGFSPMGQVEQHRDAKEKATLEQADAATPRVKAVPPWAPQVDSSLLATRDEVVSVINGGVVARIIDVRSESDYTNKTGLGVVRAIPNMGAINIHWKEFLTAQGRPRIAFKKKLESVGIKPEQRIIVVSENGVSSAAVTMCLRAMGYNNSSNYSGGLIDLISTKSDR